ncbi:MULTISPECIES: YbgF trimerization domain-containing protein [Microbulbifer]|uniref:YbgF trimerization domain-containing protein n=1 Tax=Microbulbifer TaxID=48073 RepID=UPI001E5A8D5D|nr:MULTISPECIES: YbgF trimerization domain-containing protein [Microbulbifer]UHQ54682.1 tetratricopeptide repeat protein [Microbulbifer sp. YPW16]
MVAASPVFSQAPIVELGNDSGNAAPAYEQDSTYADARTARAPVSARPRAQGNPQADAYYQMQVLQQEVSELRGAVEELRHEVKRLKQQRTEDYMDLDRRIARLSGAAPAEQPPAAGDDAKSGGDASRPADTGSPAASDDERERYQSSFGLAREGKFDAASVEFEKLLEDYPNGKYAPNANYWLGEIALVQGNLEKAREWFTALLDGYPESNKVWDGRYKLGTVYHQLGDDQQARELLEQVAASDARAAKLAKKYLQENL